MADLNIGPETPETHDLAKMCHRGILPNTSLLRRAMRLAQALEAEVIQLREKVAQGGEQGQQLTVVTPSDSAH